MPLTALTGSVSGMTVTSTHTRQRRIENPLQKDAAVFLETSAETGGARTLLEIELAPGGGNAPHRHTAFAEHFEAVEGTLTVKVGDRVQRLAPGEQATAAAGALHAFSNETEERIRFRVELTPGHEGFERSLQIAYGLARAGLVRADGLPRSPVHAALLVGLSDTHVPGAAGVLARLLAPVAWVARLRGVDRRLIERYGVA